MKTRLMWLCAVFGAAGIFVGIWYFHRPSPVEGIRVRISPAPVAQASESVPIELDANAHAKTRPASNGSSKQPAPSNGVPSFGGQKDLWAFAKKAEDSGDAGFKYEGYIAARECTGLLNLPDHNNKLVETALRTGNQGPYLALAELNKRCAGFSSATPAEGMQLVHALKAQIAASNSSLAPLVVNRELSDAERQAVLRSATPAAMELVLPRIQSEAGDAILLAMCDLGKACGVDSFGALLFCLDTGKCGQPLWADAADEYDPEEWQAIQLERDRIVRLVKAGDFQSLFKKS